MQVCILLAIRKGIIYYSATACPKSRRQQKSNIFANVVRYSASIHSRTCTEVNIADPVLVQRVNQLCPHSKSAESVVPY